ncbi:proteasome-associated protein ECM29-like protein isoform X1 [Iris pallida]|uniref:Proteasome-associated protein ECM29-like protein isoform X1 n=1 Tax=Iris pallida TaxID=29817 RepID=A0AAX6G242_IRIPA|nr:proteasome-associated protein ECM29-like protein isoform X1 [Iris pallida]
MTAAGFKWRSQRWNETEREQEPPLLLPTKVNANYLKECTAPIEKWRNERESKKHSSTNTLDEQYNPSMLQRRRGHRRSSRTRRRHVSRSRGTTRI